jgi:hypothetical protein
VQLELEHDGRVVQPELERDMYHRRVVRPESEHDSEHDSEHGRVVKLGLERD